MKKSHYVFIGVCVAMSIFYWLGFIVIVEYGEVGADIPFIGFSILANLIALVPMSIVYGIYLLVEKFYNKRKLKDKKII